MKTTIGGNRLGSGKKMTADLHGFDRSTHDLGYVWRNTQSPGTLVPFLVEVGLPGDTFDIDLNAHVLTHPTLGPLYGSYKFQADVFTIPMRLYNRALLINQQKIGLDAANIKLPLYVLESHPANVTPESQINPSSIFAYLGARGIGQAEDPEGINIRRAFNMIPLIGMYDIYKNYYANQQEEIGAFIHTEPVGNTTYYSVKKVTGSLPINHGYAEPGVTFAPGDQIAFEISSIFDPDEFNRIPIEANTVLLDSEGKAKLLTELFTFEKWVKVGEDTEWAWYGTLAPGGSKTIFGWNYTSELPGAKPGTTPLIKTFPLHEIDSLITAMITTSGIGTPPYVWSKDASPVPNLQNIFHGSSNGNFSYQYSQEGLLLKTYQNDMFNNWMKSEWITNISAITAVSTSAGSFTVDSLNLANKVYNMLTRIAISGGTIYDYYEASYDENVWKQANTPVYQGGLSKEVVFQEVVATTAAQTEGGEQVLGQLAGKGKFTDKHKGGNITVRVNEPCYVMGIVSLTPRIDYSQGNRWDVNLKSIGDLHTPGMDQIGFQDLITDKMATFDTTVTNTANPVTVKPTFRSAGKQPAWLDYMTNYNRTYGNFALQDNEMFMTLNRNYERDLNNRIKDLTTYIDPAKYNFIFAEPSIDAMNFWIQLGIGMTVRRKMSAKVMPNL